MRRTTVVGSCLAGLGLAGVPAEPVAAAGRGHHTVTVTNDEPIDIPIVILTE